jgi:ATP-dependent RNA helicase RhlE
MRVTLAELIRVSEHKHSTMPPTSGSDQTTSKNTASFSGEDSFASLGIAHTLVDAMASMDCMQPRAVQAQVVPAVLEGRDVVALAETGSGKTLAYLAPVMQQILDDRPAKGRRLTARQRLRAVVICPTRELADQVGTIAERLIRGTVLRSGVAVGSTPMSPQVELLSRGIDLLVGTPGRLMELVKAEALDLSTVTRVVVDEADRMLDMGFVPQVDRLLGLLPSRRQTVLATATMPGEVEQLARTYLRKPIRIETHPHTVAVDHVREHVVMAHPHDRVELLLQLLAQGSGRTLVFCRTRRRTAWVASALAKQGIKTGQLHADRSQAQRRRALEGLRDGTLDVLVSTDVASRGLHIEGVATVINYDLPNTAEDFVHRVGRAAHGEVRDEDAGGSEGGEGGSEVGGDAWSFIWTRELDDWYRIAKAAGVSAHPERVDGFVAKAGKRTGGDVNVDPRGRSGRGRRPGPGRRKRASRPIAHSEKPGRGIRRPPKEG